MLVYCEFGQVTADLAPGFVRDIGADKAEFEFKKPKSLKIGGSYAIGCLVKPEFNVDLFVQLPKVFSYLCNCLLLLIAIGD